MPLEAEHLMLSRELKNRQITVSERAKVIESALFPVTGQEIRIGRNRYVTVYEFPSRREARSHMKKFEKNGTPTHVEGWQWPDIPHLYQARNSIIVYVGRDREILDVLNEIYLLQSAGGPWKESGSSPIQNNQNHLL